MTRARFRQRARAGRVISPDLRYPSAMRLLAILSMLLALGGGPALGDQTDSRLDGLFARLQVAASAGEAAPIEAQIWGIWFETADSAAASLLLAGNQAMRVGDHDAALLAFDRIVAIAPDFAEGWNRRATLHYLMGNLEQSLDDITATLDLEPRHFGALSGRGLVYAGLDDLENALAAFEAALAVSPQMTGSPNNAEAIRAILKGQEI